MSLSSDVIERLPRVEGVLNYLAPMAEKTMNLTYDPPPGVPRSTGIPEPHVMRIHDARRVAGRLTLDGEGLALVEHRSAEAQRTKLPITFRLSWAGIELDYDRGRRRGPQPYGRLQRINASERNWSSRRTNSHLRARSRFAGVGARKYTRLTMSGGVLK